jgi:hypothetical protein
MPPPSVRAKPERTARSAGATAPASTREDDAFADMEAEDLCSGRNPPLQRNIAAFGFLKRHMNDTIGEQWTRDIRGPLHFRREGSPSS